MKLSFPETLSSRATCILAATCMQFFIVAVTCDGQGFSNLVAEESSTVRPEKMTNAGLSFMTASVSGDGYPLTKFTYTDQGIMRTFDTVSFYFYFSYDGKADRRAAKSRITNQYSSRPISQCASDFMFEDGSIYAAKVEVQFKGIFDSKVEDEEYILVLDIGNLGYKVNFHKYASSILGPRSISWEIKSLEVTELEREVFDLIPAYKVLFTEWNLDLFSICQVIRSYKDAEYTSKLASLLLPNPHETDILRRLLSSKRRSFEYAKFGMELYPVQKIEEFGKGNERLFARVNLDYAAFPGKSKKEVEGYRAAILKGVKSFEDIAREFSDAEHTRAGGGDGGWVCVASSWWLNLSDMDHLNAILALRPGELSQPFHYLDEWGLIKCRESSEKADFSDGKTLDAVFAYLKMYRRDLIEEHLLGLAESFIAQAEKSSFVEACKRFQREPLSTGFLPFPRAICSLSPYIGLSYSYEPVFRYMSDEDYLRLYAPSSGAKLFPIVHDEDVYVLRTADEAMMPESEVSSILAFLQAALSSILNTGFFDDEAFRMLLGVGKAMLDYILKDRHARIVENFWLSGLDDIESIEQANSFFTKGDIEGALKSYRKYAKSHPRTDGADVCFFNILTCLESLGQTSSLEKEYKSFGENPKNKLLAQKSLYNLARISLGKGALAEAAEYFRKIADLDSDGIFRIISDDYLLLLGSSLPKS